MLKKDLILQITNLTDHYLKEKINWVNEKWIRLKYNYRVCRIDNKKATDIKKCAIKLKLKFEEYKHCLESTQLENKIND